MGKKCELWLFLVVYHIHIHKHPETYQKMIMQMLMYRLFLELMYQVAHSIEIAVGHFMAFSKRCPESLQRLRPVLPATLKRWLPNRAHSRVSSVVVCIFLRILISSWVLGWLCPYAPLRHVHRGIAVEPCLLEVATVSYDDYTPAKINETKH